MGCSIKGNGKEGELVVDGAPTGLILNHAYSIFAFVQFPDPHDPKNNFRLVVLRNPWGHKEW